MYLVKIYSSGNVVAELTHADYTGAIGMITSWDGYNQGLTYDIRKVKDSVYGRNEKSV